MASLAFFFCFFVSVAFAQEAKKPLSLEDIEQLLRIGVSSSGVARVVDEREVNFEVTEDVKEKLRKAGADSTVIQAVEKAALEFARKRNEKEEPGAGVDVAKVQRLLKALGYEPGPADGVAGARTRDAVRSFQRAAGLQADGEIADDLVRRLTARLSRKIETESKRLEEQREKAADERRKAEEERRRLEEERRRGEREKRQAKKSKRIRRSGLTIASLTSGVRNSRAFPEHQLNFSQGFETVWATVNRVLQESGDTVARSGQESGVIVTNLTVHRDGFFPRYDQYYILVQEEAAESTNVSFKLFTYFESILRRGRLKPSKDVIPRAKQFINRLEAVLGPSR